MDHEHVEAGDPKRLPPRLFYIQGIIRNRLIEKNFYYPEKGAMPILADCWRSGVPIEQMESIARSFDCRNWTNFRDALWAAQNAARRNRPCEFVRDEILIAEKKYRCLLCDVEIWPKEAYLRRTYRVDGKVEYETVHQVCAAMADSWTQDEIDSIGPAEFRERLKNFLDQQE